MSRPMHSGDFPSAACPARRVRGTITGISSMTMVFTLSTLRMGWATGLDLFGVVVAIGACVEAGREDGDHLGTAGLGLFADYGWPRSVL